MILLRILIVVVALAAAGCGKKASPMPPLRNVPAPVENLGIRQVGDRLILSFPPPARRADGSRLSADTTVHLLMTAADPPPRQPMALVQSAAVSWRIPASEWHSYRQGDRLDIPLSLGRIASELTLAEGARSLHGRRLSFVAEVSEVGHRTSDPSDIETISVCAPPSPPAGASVRILEEGLLVTWEPAAEPGKLHLYRRVDDEAVSQAPYAALPAGSSSYLDAEAVAGSAHRYTVRIAATAGARCESAGVSPPPATRVDLFPPRPPEALAVVVEQGGLRLFWRPGGEADLRGYHVYRGDGERGAMKLMTPELLTSSSWTDRDVSPGVVYIYAVTSLDGAEPPNESEWSDAVTQKLESRK